MSLRRSTRRIVLQTSQRVKGRFNVYVFTVAAAVAAIAGMIFVPLKWGNESLWPGLVGNFVASLIAFALALAWDRRQRASADEATRQREAEEAQRLLKDEQDRRETEVRRRLLVLRPQLKQLEQSVESVLEKSSIARYFLPDLPTGAWEANAEPLSRLLADHQLVADLSTFHDRVRDLQWRLRFKAEEQRVTQAQMFETMIEALAQEIKSDLPDLHRRVNEQIAHPDVQRLGVTYKIGIVDTGLSMT